MPGVAFRESASLVLGELQDLPHVPELPGRGVYAGMIGRTAALITELGVDLQPAGWRLTDTSGLDHRRSVSLLNEDLDVFEELHAGREGEVKIQFAGPWTLAAAMERPRGDKVLADFGARRDLAQALAEGVGRQVADVRRRVSPATVVLQIDEPSLPAVLDGRISTASGFSRHRAVEPAEAAAAIDWIVESAGDDVSTVLHCCASRPPVALLAKTSVDALSFDLRMVESAAYDDLGEWLDSGRTLWPGMVPATDPGDPPPTAVDLTDRLLRWWSDIGYTDLDTLPATTVTPTCGLAGASPAWARSALDLAREIARNLSAEAGRIAP